MLPIENIITRTARQLLALGQDLDRRMDARQDFIVVMQGTDGTEAIKVYYPDTLSEARAIAKNWARKKGRPAFLQVVEHFAPKQKNSPKPALP